MAQKKGLDSPFDVPIERKKPLTRSVKLNDRPPGVGLIEDGLAVVHTDEEAIEANAVELSGDAVAELMRGGDERIRERAAFHADDAEGVFDVGGRLFQSEGLDVVADVDALVEGLEALELEHMAQVGLAEEDEGKRGGGIHLGAVRVAVVAQQRQDRGIAKQRNRRPPGLVGLRRTDPRQILIRFGHRTPPDRKDNDSLP